MLGKFKLDAALNFCSLLLNSNVKNMIHLLDHKTKVFGRRIFIV